MEEAFMDLSTLRNEIDRIDSQLVQLYDCLLYTSDAADEL